MGASRSEAGVGRGGVRSLRDRHLRAPRRFEIGHLRRHLEPAARRFDHRPCFHGLGEGTPLGADPPRRRRLDRLELKVADAVGHFSTIAQG
jgi:hypothetical protein